MPSWKKLITSGSQAALNTLEINPQPTTGTTTHGANLQIVASGSATQFGLLITGSTGNGTPLAMIQTPVGGSGTGEFIYGRGIYGEESFRIRQGAGGSGTFALYCSSSFVIAFRARSLFTAKFLSHCLVKKFSLLPMSKPEGAIYSS